MTAPDRAQRAESEQRPGFFEALAVYLKPRVLVVLFLGFSSGLPLVLSGATLQAWMKTSGVDIRTIGLIGAVGIPYSIKFLWAPVVDALDVPLLSRLLGRRRGWLIFSQILLMAAIVLLAFADPMTTPWLIAGGALAVATASATQDIVIDAFRVESLPEEEQAAGMASYVAAYRVGMLVAGAGALVLVARLDALGFSLARAWTVAYVVMAVLVVVGVAATLVGTEPAKSTMAEADHVHHAAENPLRRAVAAAIASFTEFLSQDMAWAILLFVALFKIADALAYALITPFVLDLNFSLEQLAAVTKGVGFAATLIGGFAGGFIARSYPLARSLWIGGVLQTVTILLFSLQAVVGLNLALLTGVITVAYFADAMGTVIFVAYLSALCRNPLHTATQYALLTALAALGRNVFSIGTGYLVHAVGWFWFFALCTCAAIPGLLLLAWLQSHGHFVCLEPRRK
jgi:PAT family beta-lactamase induction signal transducer AmpG